MNFKDDVMFYLGTMISDNDSPIEEAMIDILEGESVCPKCGRDPCACDKKCSTETDDDEEEASVKTKCNASRSTETAAGDDDDDGYEYHASAETECSSTKDKVVNANKLGVKMPSDGFTPEEVEILKQIIKNKKNSSAKTECSSTKDKVVNANKLGAKMPSDGFTPEEIEILKQAAKNKKNASVNLPDDHTNGRNGSVETEAELAKKVGIKIPADGFTPEEIEIIKQIIKNKKNTSIKLSDNKQTSSEKQLKESISRYAFDNSYEDKNSTKVASILKGLIKSKKMSKTLRECNNFEAANEFLLAEEMYENKEPGALKKYKAAVKKYL